MSNWWDNGIKGNSNSINIVTSSAVSVIGGVANLNGYSNSGFIVGKEPPDTIETVTPNLIMSTQNGTQVFIDVITKKAPTTRVFYRPEETRNFYEYTAVLRLHKPNVSDLTYSTEYIFAHTIAGIADMYQFETRIIQDDEDSQRYYGSRAFPFSKGGMVNNIGVISQDDGLHFYVVGFPGKQIYGNYTYTAPAREICLLPSSALNNAFWFDPDTDHLDDADRDPSGTGGGRGTGTYNYPGEDIGFPELPNVSVIDIANYNMFNPTGAQLGNVISKLWFEDFSITEIIEVIQRFIFKPKESLVSVTMLPFNVNSGAASRVYLGKMNTGVDAPVVLSQFQTIDCGTLNVPLRYASVLDYSPYQKAVLFIPFVGFRNINVDQIAGGTIAIKYNVDVLTGSAQCFVRITDNESSNNSVLYTYDCNLAIQVPISSDKYDAMVGSLIRLGGALIGAKTGGQFGMSTAGKAIPSAIDAISASHGIDQSGQLGSTVGILGEFQPYLVLEQVNQSLPAGYESYEGYPSNITASLSNMSGYTEIESIHLNIPGATDTELAEIESLLTSGVIL